MKRHQTDTRCFTKHENYAQFLNKMWWDTDKNTFYIEKMFIVKYAHATYQKNTYFLYKK